MSSALQIYVSNAYGIEPTPSGTDKPSLEGKSKKKGRSASQFASHQPCAIFGAI
jgi:hypothetical protein